jgi:hypothetical protein
LLGGLDHPVRSSSGSSGIARCAADILVRYRDLRSGDAFIARPPREQALHAFYHPNAYAPAAEAAGRVAGLDQKSSPA